MPISTSRRHLLVAAGGLGLSMILPGQRGLAQAQRPATDVTFLFSCDVHACLVSADALSPNCADEGKTDAALLKHVAAVNGIAGHAWPAEIDGKPTGLAGAGSPIATPRGLVFGGDMTDDGGGQVKVPGEGRQLQQFSSRYQQGTGPDRVHYPVYTGLGNHDLDQDGVPPHADWYRRELRDYIELNHRSTVFYKAPVPVTNYDIDSDNYSWDWSGLHLVQLQRFGGDGTKGAISGLPWLQQDLATYAADGRPVVLFQHYGWDDFSTEHWDPVAKTFDPHGSGPAHWWTDEARAALLATLTKYNVVGIFHGHEHPTPMIYNRDGHDIFKPVAAFMGGLAVVRVTDQFMDVALARAGTSATDIIFTHAFSKRLGG
ncbi:metallophosphoesterase [Shinella oryzae]|uniref:metallophosphoesterase n=1 Tax=Shinella oryzae TaxID=2871820 RepID=UPI003CCD328E|nr:metallophosphoesterase [Shinella oryzae]